MTTFVPMAGLEPAPLVGSCLPPTLPTELHRLVADSISTASAHGVCFSDQARPNSKPTHTINRALESPLQDPWRETQESNLPHRG